MVKFSQIAKFGSLHSSKGTYNIIVNPSRINPRVKSFLPFLQGPFSPLSTHLGHIPSQEMELKEEDFKFWNSLGMFKSDVDF